MKKISSILLLAGFCLLGAACSDDEEPLQGLAINTADTGFEADGGEGGISIASMGEVKAFADKDWIEITSVAADSVRFRVGPNPDAMLRTGKITVEGISGSKEVTILQKGSMFGIYADSVALKGMGGEEFAVSVKYVMSGVGVSDLKIEGRPEWLTVTPVNDSIVFTAERNPEEERQAELTFTAGWKTVRLIVTQNALRWLTDFYGNELKEILLTADKGEQYDAFQATEDLEGYDPDWSIAVAAGGDWLTIGEDPWGNKNMLQFTENETGKTRSTSLEITAKGEVIGTLPVHQLPVDKNGAYFRGTWTLHSVNEEGLPQDIEITVSPISPFSPANLKIVGLDQQFGDRDPATATVKTGSDGISYVEMKCQDLKFKVTASSNRQQYDLWIVPLSEGMSLVRNESAAWNFEYDRATESVVIKPNDYIATTLPNANDGMQFPGLGIIGYNASIGYANFGLGLYFPDPSRGCMWLEKAAE